MTHVNFWDFEKPGRFFQPKNVAGGDLTFKNPEVFLFPKKCFCGGTRATVDIGKDGRKGSGNLASAGRILVFVANCLESLRLLQNHFWLGQDCPRLREIPDFATIGLPTENHGIQVCRTHLDNNFSLPRTTGKAYHL